MKHRFISGLVLAAAVSVVGGLSGCAVVPQVLNGGLTKKSEPVVYTLEGKGNSVVSFKQAVSQQGGTVTASSGDYTKAEFAAVAVKVELQKIRNNQVQIIGSSNTTVSRNWEIGDGIGETTKKVVDHLVSNGFKITNAVRGTGF